MFKTKSTVSFWLATCTLLAGSALLSQAASAATASSVTYYSGTSSEITFKFAKSYEVGTFANGDYWVHNNGGSVVITQITPVGKTSGGRRMNGTMVNPSVNGNEGYDSAPRDMTYVNSLNVDPGNTGSNLTVSAGSSVIKSISKSAATGRPAISDAAVLTVLSSSPADGSFRPPYAGTDKSILGNANNLKYSALGSYQRLGSEPDIDTVAGYYSKVWLEHNTEWTQRDIHPANNMPAYGRDIAKRLAYGLILLNLDYSKSEKKELLINMVQYGIDLYGVARNGGVWYNNGGHNLGRKAPLILAANVLNNANMKLYADGESYTIFQDDQQHFYVSQTEVNMTHSSAWAPDSRADPVAYTSSDIGTAEWGIRHYDKPKADNANWSATYRDVNGPAQTMQIFAAQLMGVKKQWNWPAVFDYADRYYGIEKDSGKFPTWFKDLWSAYRNNLVSHPSAPTNLKATVIE